MFRYHLLPLLLTPALVVGCKAKTGPPPGALNTTPQVKVSVPVQDLVTDFEEFTGRMDALKTVDIRARVSGYLQQIKFKDGEEVAAGKVLFEIDPRTYRAILAQTEANLRLAQAHFKRLTFDFLRAQSLLPRRAISQEDYDKVAGDRDEAEQAVGVALANRETARINVDYTQVLAPIGGRISRRFLDLGNMIKADDTILTRIVYLQQMYVYFDINERTYLKLQRLIQDGQIPTAQDNNAEVKLRLADEKDYSHPARIDFEDNQLDMGTGTRRVRAVVDNPVMDGRGNRFFSPNLFARVRLEIGQPHQALLVAEQALQTDQGKKFLYVIKDPKKVEKKIGDQVEVWVEGPVESRPVEIGRLQNGLREIKAGLKAGEFVVVRGLQRVRPKFPATFREKGDVRDMRHLEDSSLPPDVPPGKQPDKSKLAPVEKK